MIRWMFLFGLILVISQTGRVSETPPAPLTDGIRFNGAFAWTSTNPGQSVLRLRSISPDLLGIPESSVGQDALPSVHDVRTMPMLATPKSHVTQEERKAAIPFQERSSGKNYMKIDADRLQQIPSSAWGCVCAWIEKIQAYLNQICEHSCFT